MEVDFVTVKAPKNHKDQQASQGSTGMSEETVTYSIETSYSH
jgi:hypothetical protein